MNKRAEEQQHRQLRPWTFDPPILPKLKMLPNVLNFMDGSRRSTVHVERPQRSATDIFDVLRRAVNERRRIEVLIRDCRGICGIMTGWLLAFDKNETLSTAVIDRRMLPVESTQNSQVVAKTSDVPSDFQTFRAQLANFLRNKKKTDQGRPQRRHHRRQAAQDESEDEHPTSQIQEPCPCRPELFLAMEMLSIHNQSVQRLSGKMSVSEPSASNAATQPISKRAKVRFFARHIPKLFIKGNQVCLIRLLSP
jgi:hypothetical protein